MTSLTEGFPSPIAVGSTAELAALTTGTMHQGQVAFVGTADGSWLVYRWDGDSSAAADGTETIVPLHAPTHGRFIRLGDTNPSTDGALGAFIGAFLDSPVVTVTSNGTTILLNLEQSGTGDVRVQFSDGVYDFDATPIATVALTAGTDTVPVLNYVYILQSDKALTASTTGWPATEHAPVATVFCQTAASLATQGAYKVHAWTDHVVGSDGQGHLGHLNYWIRQQPATWTSGVALTPTVGAATFDIATTAGVVLQLHQHTMPVVDTDAASSVVYIANHPDTPYRAATDLTQTFVDKDANGTALGGVSTDFYNLVIWGAVNEAAADCKIYVNVPDGAYANNNANAASDDTEATAIYAIPSEFRGVGFLIARLTVQEAAGTYSIIQQSDLRGLSPSTIAGGTLNNITVPQTVPLTTPTVQDVIDALILAGILLQSD